MKIETVVIFKTSQQTWWNFNVNYLASMKESPQDYPTFKVGQTLGYVSVECT